MIEGLSSRRLVTRAARRGLLLASLLTALPGTAGAQARRFPDFTLEELMRVEIEPVFGASKRLQPVTEAPASVTIVTRDEIARYGYRSLADVLRGVRGFYVTDDRNYSYLGARGFGRAGDYDTRILVLVDGHRMNDDIYEQGAIGRELGVDAAMFERVEIVRGPSSSLYGTSAFLAVINVIMRKGADLNGVTGAADTGSSGSRSGYVAAGGRLAHGIEAAFSASYSGRDGALRLYVPAFDAPESNGGIAEHLDDEQSRQLFGRVTVAGVSLTGAYGDRDKGVPTASFGTVFNDPRMRTTDRRGFLDAEYSHAVRGTQVALRGYLDRYRYNGAFPFAAAGAAPAYLYRDYAIGTWTGGEARFTRTVAQRHAVTLGTEFRANLRQAQGATIDASDEGGFAVDRSSKAGATYLQDDITLHRVLHASLGVRYDAYGEFARVTPRAALIVSPSRRQSIKYLYGTAFRAPNAYELDYYSEGVRDRTLRAETIASHEVVWERYTGTWLRTSASAYRNDVGKLLTLMVAPEGNLALAWANHGRVRAAGVEFEGEWRVKRLEGLASYTFQRTRDADTGERLTNSPPHALKLRLSTPGPARGGTMAVETQTLGRRLTLAGHVLPPTTLANLTIVEPLGRRLDAVGAIHNLFGLRYSDPGSEEHRQDVIEQDGRTFSVGLRWRFRAP